MTLQLQAPPLTEREAEVLALLDRHMTNAQIAQSLFISVRTVESHVSSMLRKLGVSDRRSLARSTATTGPAMSDSAACRSRRSAGDQCGSVGHRIVNATGFRPLPAVLSEPRVDDPSDLSTVPDAAICCR
jgi:DNA-binding CsgD family transcriptional regulator